MSGIVTPGVDGTEAFNTAVQEKYAPGYEDNVNNIAHVEIQSGYANIATAATTVVKASAGRLIALIVNTPVASGVIKLYDNTAGSGTVIGTVTYPATLLTDGPIAMFIGGGKFGTGLTIVTTGVMDITVWFE